MRGEHRRQETIFGDMAPEARVSEPPRRLSVVSRVLELTVMIDSSGSDRPGSWVAAAGRLVSSSVIESPVKTGV